jgi:hypothetical protein
MLGLIIDLFQAFYEARDERRLRDSTIRAYESAWRSRERTGDSRVEVLDAAFTRAGVSRASEPGADVQAAFDAWSAGLSPRQATKLIRDAERR